MWKSCPPLPLFLRGRVITCFIMNRTKLANVDQLRQMYVKRSLYEIRDLKKYTALFLNVYDHCHPQTSQCYRQEIRNRKYVTPRKKAHRTRHTAKSAFTTGLTSSA